MTSVNKHILVVGSGSAGKRHARNLASRGCTISSMDPRQDRLAELAEETPVERGFDSIEAALENSERLDGVVIASPPFFHVDQAIAAIEAKFPVLLEKPVSPDATSARKLARTCESHEVPLLLGYTWRWWPPLRDVKTKLDSGVVGRLRHVRFTMSAHLADWHPWERYQDFFMSSRELGGGAILDESHWIDLALWFFGMPRSVSARIEKISDLEIDADDNVDMIMEFDDGLRATLHLDLFGRPHEKSIRFVGEEGSCLWTESPNRVAFSGSASEDWDETTYTCERNDMFMGVTEEFLDVLDGQSVTTCSIEDGVRVLDVIEAARRSHEEERRIPL
ncbi:MAG: dehydrogenase [Alphaproteobacteria bacterium]|nr:dehydrogenase [Alphaproteobacteria bacterium]